MKTIDDFINDQYLDLYNKVRNMDYEDKFIYVSNVMQFVCGAIEYEFQRTGDKTAIINWMQIYEKRFQVLLD